MKANNTPNISDLARWIDIQLSTIIEGVSAGYTLGNGNTVCIDKGDKVFTVSLANGNTVKIDSDNYNNSKEIANAIIETINTHTPSTMNANETTEFSELTHAGQCLDIYLHNTSDIYERYTVPAIERVTRAIKAGEYVSDNAGQLAKDIQEITPAIQAAARLVKKHDHMTPTAKDIEQVTRNYAAYIVDCAKYEIDK